MPLPEDWKLKIEDTTAIEREIAREALEDGGYLPDFATITPQRCADAAAKKAAVAALEWAASACEKVAREWGGDAGLWESAPASNCEEAIRAKLKEISEGV